MLGPAEQAQAAHRSRWRALDYARGRITARAALYLAAQGSPAVPGRAAQGGQSERVAGMTGPEILSDGEGRPVLRPDAGPWRVSISHTEGAVAATVGTTSFGVDVEAAGRDLASVLPVITHVRDRTEGLSPVIVFSCKEAAAKASGCRGLAHYPVVRTDGGVTVAGLTAHIHHAWQFVVVTASAVGAPRVRQLDVTEAIACARLAT
jgi:4'-phosphopantetheinyl transferase EntD